MKPAVIMNVLLLPCLSILFVTTALSDNSTLTSNIGDDVDSMAELDAESEQLENEPKAQQWQVASRDPGTGGWTPWSRWSTCSRTCDGGVSHQLRRCNSFAGCHGDPVRYKICNMQPCPDSRDFRQHQCAAYNDVPYEGTLYHWSPHTVENEPCALTCRGRHAIVPIRTEDMEGHEDDDPLIVVQLAPKVQDGTRCRPGSLDMCINGKCERVGCDLRIGSTKKVDSCGVCGGDGTSCAQPVYLWHDGPFSLCSVTCGGGYKISRPVCRNRLTGSDVEEQLCDESNRPEPKLLACQEHRCPPRWATAPWGPCSASCGGGTRLRAVHCLQQIENGTKIKIAEHACRSRKPRYQEVCNELECPKWHPAPWSGCSVSCGEGVQIRTIYCKDSSDLTSTLCDPEAKPTSTQSCSTGITCPGVEEDVEIGRESTSTSSGEELVPVVHGSNSAKGTIGFHSSPFVHPYAPSLPAKAERLIGEEIGPSEATFITGEWGPCSTADGIRRREVNCKIFLEFSKTLAKLPDEKCVGPKPPDMERCDRFYGDYPVKPGTYSWKEVGYADCSASCLGGTQEMIIMCINDSNLKPASPFMCSPSTKPEVKVRTCNDHPCPPRWNYSDFQLCTKSCGMGIQTRDVNCIHEITSGAGNTLIVPNSMCPQPPPPDRQYCNVLDCPIKWEVTEWSKCSKSCGGGIKERKVQCKQVMAQNHIVERPDHMCPKSRPPSGRPCNTKSCALESDKPYIATTNSSYVQHDSSRKKVTAKVGGSATVFYGITLKIKCPVKRYDRSKIKWAKDQNFISKSKKYKISKKGALRIQNLAYRDSGIYTCVAGYSSADLTVSVKPRPGEFPSSEEIDHANRIDEAAGVEASDVAASRNDAAHRPFLISGDDHSHEQRPGDGTISYPKKQKPRVWATRPPPTRVPVSRNSEEDGNINRLDALLPNLSTTLFADQQKLWPFQTFTNSRGHRMISSPHDEHAPRVRDMHSETPNEDHTSDSNTTSTDQGFTFEFTTILSEDNDEEEEDVERIEVLGKGSRDNLKFNWMITDWSECSLTCGGDGYQMRAAQCMVHLFNVTRDVHDNLCEDAGMEKPITVRSCGREECPRWTVSDWTPCEKSRCFTWNTAMQRREVSCQTPNSTEVDLSKCDQREKPPQRQECYNDKCKGTWKVGEWSDCAASCEAQGIKYRILQCVWYGTKRAAGNACREQPRPAVMKMCKGPPCPANK